jgi:predicted metal-dependent hydrolase
VPETGRVTEDPRFRAGAAFFDKEDFFEAHEEWESLWHETRGEPRDFVQGLIQVTSALHHLQIRNMKGARLLHDSGVELLAPYGDAYQGVDLKTLRTAFDRSLAEILSQPLTSLTGRAHAGPVLIPYTPARAFKLPFDPA